jgi:hypothetical protein
MPYRTPTWERPESIRERARWYRAYAAAHPGESDWALRLAAHLERHADELEARQATALLSPKPDTADPD